MVPGRLASGPSPVSIQLFRMFGMISELYGFPLLEFDFRSTEEPFAEWFERAARMSISI